MKTLSKAEASLLKEFLDDIQKRMYNASCNDLHLKNTKDNRELVASAMTFSELGETLDLPSEHGAEIITMDIIVFKYLRHRLSEVFGVDLC